MYLPWFFWIAFFFIFLAASRAFIVTDLYAYIAKNRMRYDVNQFTFILLAIGAWIALNGLLLLYVLKLESKVYILRLQNCILRLQFYILRLKRRHFLFLVDQALAKNSRKRELFQYVSDYAHSVILKPKPLTK